MKLTKMSQQVFDYVKENGGRISIEELCAALGRTARSIGANVTDLANHKGLVAREKIVNEDDKEVTYVVLTDEGRNFVPSEDDE